jgi:6-phosphogluconolactonase
LLITLRHDGADGTRVSERSERTIRHSSAETTVVVHADADVLASAVAARLIVKTIDAQAERGWAGIVLTGGRIAAAVHRAVRTLKAADAIDWSHVDVWWGDERFLPAGHPDRNETQAREALLDALPLDPAHVHPMPSSDGPDGDDPEAAAARYAAELANAARPGTAELPHFDVLMLGVGEDGHVASVFPEHPVAYETRPVSAVRGSPKPPPVRITLALPAIRTAEEVWLIAAGPDKAPAVGMALEGAGPVQLPAAGAVGVERTLWLLDRAAAANLSPRVRSLR